ncbi:MAG TPA: hypothetical protein VF222_10845 [Nitrososphaeraceae archaeon]
MASTNNQNINPRPCVNNCGIQIYWNVATNEYWEVFTKKKHICPNRSNKPQVTNTTATTTAAKPNYYNGRKSFTNVKPKMSNSFELLTGPIDIIQKKYEMLSDIVIVEYGGKVHGSQRDRDPKTGLIDLLVYYEVPLGQRDEVKKKFENFTKSHNIVLQK